MARPSKSIDSDALLGEIAFVRSAIWQNGKMRIAAFVSAATTDPALLPEGAVALVSVTAFPPGVPSRLLIDVPLYARAPAEGVLPAAWLKRG
ncbi:hypothetical protein [Pandoraea horticolens]|uniref:hypothetical protein n=1 Tax=Pandoraea horticolens TaxID=2508298 RepID=UPI0012420304|nr:hypothetical protein [Pandoraea horticolens]